MSELMTLARQIQREVDAIVSKFHGNGKVDLGAVAQMEKLRHAIITTESDEPLDTLMQLGCVRSVASFLLSLIQNTEDDEATLQLVEFGLLEILVGLNAIRPSIEKHAGATLLELGLFSDAGAVQ